MLKKKMLRDIINYKVQFLSIFLMALIGVMVFNGMYIDTTSFETTIDNYYNETNMADGWIYSNYLVDEFVEQVNLLGATTQMERQLVVDSKAKLENAPDITLHFVENNTLSKFYLLEGKELDINDPDGVWLDKSFADARNLKVGDTITFESEGIEITKTIRGLGYSPEYIYDSPIGSAVPNHTSTGFAYMSHKAFPSGNMTYNVLEVKFDGSPETYSKLLSYRLNGYYTTFLDRSSQYSADTVEESIAQQNSLTSVFPSIFIFISMLMLLTTMKRIISHQRTQIGVLKANGFTNNAITLHYLSSGFILVTIGSIIGTLIGPIIFHTLANPSRIVYFKFPYWNSIGFTNSILLIVFMGIMSLLVSYFSIESIISEPPSQIIKPKVPKATTSSFVEKLKIWKKLSFNIRWNYRSIKRSKFRAFMTIVGVMGCTVLLISAYGIYEQMDASKDWYFNDFNNFESKLVIDEDTSLSQINNIANQVHGDAIMESTIQIMSNETELTSLLVLNGTDLITITDSNHDKIEIGDDEVSISEKMARILNIKVGDTIDCKEVDSDKNVKIKIDRIHPSPFSQGIVMSPHKLEEIGLNYTPTSIVTSEHVTGHYDGIVSIIYLSDMIDGWDKMERTSTIIITALLFFAIVLAVVILYNLNLLSFIEMENDISTLKVLGFKSAYLTKLLATQGIFLVIIGFILGIPVAYYVLSIFLPAFGSDFDLQPSISIINMAFTFAIIISVSIIMNIFFSRKIKQLNMVDSLKALER